MGDFHSTTTNSKGQPMKSLVEICRRIESLYPFFQVCIRSISFNQTTDSKYCPTAFVTQDLKMVYNYKFIKKLNANEFATVIAHECLHVLNNHFKRMKIVQSMNNESISLMSYNLVQDLEVNSQLMDTFTVTWFEDEPPISDEFKSSILLPEKENLPPGLTFEQYLMRIKNDSSRQKSGSGGGSASMPQDDMERASKESKNEDGDGDGGNVSSQGNENDKEKNGREKMFKNSSSNRMVEDVIKRTKELMEKKQSSSIGSASIDSYDKYVTSRIRHNWRRLVKMIVNSSVQSDEDYTFSTINRRHQFDSVIFPGSYRLPSSHNILVLCDVSGSMHDELQEYLSYFSSLVEYMKKNGHKIELSVLFVSEHVHDYIKGFKLEPNKELLIPNGGGTDLTVGIEYIKEKGIKHDHLFILTDTYTSWPEKVSKKEKLKTTVITSCMESSSLSDIPYNYYIVKI